MLARSVFFFLQLSTAGPFLKDAITKHLKSLNVPVTIKYLGCLRIWGGSVEKPMLAGYHRLVQC